MNHYTILDLSNNICWQLTVFDQTVTWEILDPIHGHPPSSSRHVELVTNHYVSWAASHVAPWKPIDEQGRPPTIEHPTFDEVWAYVRWHFVPLHTTILQCTVSPDDYLARQTCNRKFTALRLGPVGCGSNFATRYSGPSSKKGLTNVSRSFSIPLSISQLNQSYHFQYKRLPHLHDYPSASPFSALGAGARVSSREVFCKIWTKYWGSSCLWEGLEIKNAILR